MFRVTNDPRHPLTRPRGQNVALMYWGSEGNGVATHLQTYAALLAEAGHNVTWYHGSSSAPEIPAVTTRYLEIVDLNRPAKSAAEVADAVEAIVSGVDTLHMHNGQGVRPQVAEGLVAVRNKRAGQKLPFALLHTFHSPFTGRLAENAKAVKPFHGHFGVSEYISEFYREQLGVDVQAVTIGTKTAKFKDVPDVAPGKKDSVTFGFAARTTDPNKGAREMYLAYTELVANWDEMTHGAKPQLRITSPEHAVGTASGASDYEKRIKNLAEAAGLWTDPERDPVAARRNLVHFEHTTSEHMPQFFAKVHVVVTPSRLKEAFGLTAAEAQAAGRVVIAARTGGLPEAVDPGSGSLLPRPAEADLSVPDMQLVADLAAAMRPLAEDRRLTAEKGARARAFAIRALDASRHAGRMIQAYYQHHRSLQEGVRSDDQLKMRRGAASTATLRPNSPDVDLSVASLGLRPVGSAERTNVPMTAPGAQRVGADLRPESDRGLTKPGGRAMRLAKGLGKNM